MVSQPAVIPSPRASLRTLQSGYQHPPLFGFHHICNNCNCIPSPEYRESQRYVNQYCFTGKLSFVIPFPIYKKVKSSIDTVAAAAVGGVTGAALTGLFSGMVLPVAKIAGLTLLGPAGGAIGIGAAVGVAGAAWLKKLIKKK